MQLKLKFLLTGTGRCGTNYMARFMTDLGMNCGHEAIFDHQGIDTALKRLDGRSKIQTSHCSIHDIAKNKPIESWFSAENIVAECSYMATPYLSHPCLSECKVIHVIRNPLLTLGSFAIDVKFFDPQDIHQVPWRNFVLSHMPEILNEKSIIEKTCRYLINWNRKIEQCKLPMIKIRMEDYPFANLYNFLGIKQPDKTLENKKINSWKKRKRELTLDDIPSGKTKDEFAMLVRDYGYNTVKLL